jgi:hypothetical protein
MGVMRLVIGDRARRALVAGVWLTAFFVTAPVAVAPGYAGAEAGLVTAALVLALPLGLAAGSLQVARLDPYVRVRAVPLLAVGVCFPLLATAAGPPWPVAFVLWLLAGCCGGLAFGLLSALNLITPHVARFRVLIVAWSGLVAATGASALLARLIAGWATPAWAVATYGGAGLLALFLLGRRWGRAGVGRAVLFATRVAAGPAGAGLSCAADCLADSAPSCSSGCQRLRG